MVKKYTKSVRFFITALTAVFLFMPVSICYSIVQSCSGSKGCNPTPETEIKAKTIGRVNRPHYAEKKTLIYTNHQVHQNFESLAQSEETYDFTNKLEGNWPDVVGYVCIKINDVTTEGDFYATLIGLKTVSLGNNEYQSTGWDKKVLWMDAGDGVPQFICGVYVPNYEEDGIVYNNVYYAPNVEYYDTATDTAYDCDMWLYLDDKDEVEDCWLLLLDENGEAIDAKQLEVGDFITSYSLAINMDEPEYFYSATIEDAFQLVQKDPTFFYAHMTPNVDFANPLTLGKINFDELDLYYILEGSRTNEDGTSEFVYSTPKKVNLKWGNAKPTKVENWWQHEMSSIMNFFLPK